MSFVTKAVGGLLGGGGGNIVIPPQPAPPAVPTIDTARQAQAALDAQRRKKGVAANLYSGIGGTVSGPLGTKTLKGS